MKFYDYVVREGYYGKNIDVHVIERWSSDGIESASISCPKYDVIPRMLGHKSWEFSIDGGSGIIGGVNRLTINDVHNAIFNEIFNAEIIISTSLGKKHDDFKSRRYFSIIKEYNEQGINVDISMDKRSSNVWITCSSTEQSMIFSMNDISYRQAIIDEVEKCKKLIDDGYVFRDKNIFGRVKKKVKGLF